jgi:hypothetical protein
VTGATALAFKAAFVPPVSVAAPQNCGLETYVLYAEVSAEFDVACPPDFTARSFASACDNPLNTDCCAPYKAVP